MDAVDCERIRIGESGVRVGVEGEGEGEDDWANGGGGGKCAVDGEEKVLSESRVGELLRELAADALLRLLGVEAPDPDPGSDVNWNGWERVLLRDLLVGAGLPVLLERDMPTLALIARQTLSAGIQIMGTSGMGLANEVRYKCLGTNRRGAKRTHQLGQQLDPRRIPSRCFLRLHRMIQAVYLPFLR